MSEFSKDGKNQVKQWLLEVSQAAEHFDGSEVSEEKLFEPLSLFDDFVRAHDDDSMGSEHEQKVAEVAFPDHPIDMPVTVDGFLDVAAEFYDRLRNVDTSHGNSDVWTMLENGGAVISQSDQVFVKTDEGQLQEGQSDNPTAYEVKTEPRLAILIAHLRNDGVNGQSVYMDDLVITQGRVDADMIREQPYNIVQISRLDMEIAVCDQVGETTFVKKGTVGSEFWDHLSKNQLKARDDVAYIDRHNDDQWWSEISEAFSGNTDINAKKVNVQLWNNRAPKLDMDLIDESLLAHRQVTGEWLFASDKNEANGKRGSYVLEHGFYAGKITARAVDTALSTDGSRGLAGKSSIAQRNAVISETHGLDYKNYKDQEDLDMDLIDESLLAHRRVTGEWLSSAAKEGVNGKYGSYILEHGHYAGQMTARALEVALQKDCARGLIGKSSIAQRNAIISQKHGLDYKNHLQQDDLDMDLIDESFLAHRQVTGEWLSKSKKGVDGKRGTYILEHGPYTGVTVVTLEQALHVDGSRGLAGKSSIAQRNTEISDKHGLDYINVHNQDDLDILLVKESLLSHWEETDEWLFANKTGADGKSYVLEHGTYAGQITVSALNANLTHGQRGLSAGSSVFKLNEELRSEMENPVLIDVGADEEEIDNSPSVE